MLSCGRCLLRPAHLQAPHLSGGFARAKPGVCMSYSTLAWRHAQFSSRCRNVASGQMAGRCPDFRPGRMSMSSNATRGSNSSGQSANPTQQSASGQGGEKKAASGWSIPRIPIALGLAVIAGFHVKHQIARHDGNVQVAPGVVVNGPWLLHVLLGMPLRGLSRLWGYVNNDMDLPKGIRAPFYRMYASMFGCNLDEMVNKDLASYPNLGSFFYREIDLAKHRPYDPKAALVSPADGTLLHWGPVSMPGEPMAVAEEQIQKQVEDEEPREWTAEIVHGIKGVGYRVSTLLGGVAPRSADGSEPTSYEHVLAVNSLDYSLDTFVGEPSGAVESQVRAHQAGTHHTPADEDPTGLFYAVIYLAPGDYHRFHSPANWTVHQRRHVHGELLSVSPKLLRAVPALFTLNERVALLGEWRHGLFTMVPVGATNVGSIKINFDQILATNRRDTEGVDVLKYTNHPQLRAMQEVGGFMLGSTVVLVFEAPVRRFRWNIPGREHADSSSPPNHGDGPIKVRVGQTLAVIDGDDPLGPYTTSQ